jgi:hypothetical protein
MTAVSAPWPPRTYVKRHSHSASTWGGATRGFRWREGVEVYLLLVRAWQEVEHIEERLDVELRKEPRGTQDRVRRLRVVRRCLVRIARHVVLRSIAKPRCHQSINQSPWFSGTRIAEEPHTHFSVSCGCGMFEYPPSSNLCTWSKFAMRCVAVPRKHEYKRKSKSARLYISSAKHQISDGSVLTFLLHVLEGNHKIRQKAR